MQPGSSPELFGKLIMPQHSTASAKTRGSSPIRSANAAACRAAPVCPLLAASFRAAEGVDEASLLAGKRGEILGWQCNVEVTAGDIAGSEPSSTIPSAVNSSRRSLDRVAVLAALPPAIVAAETAALKAARDPDGRPDTVPACSRCYLDWEAELAEQDSEEFSRQGSDDGRHEPTDGHKWSAESVRGSEVVAGESAAGSSCMLAHHEDPTVALALALGLDPGLLQMSGRRPSPELRRTPVTATLRALRAELTRSPVCGGKAPVAHARAATGSQRAGGSHSSGVMLRAVRKDLKALKQQLEQAAQQGETGHDARQGKNAPDGEIPVVMTSGRD